MPSRKPLYLQTEHTNRERWLISYTDIVTILLILFVAVAAHSMKAQADSRLPSLPSNPPGVEKPRPRDSLLQIEDLLKNHHLEIRLESRGLVISLPQTILFASGDDRISNDARPIVASIASTIRDLPNHVTLVGYADNLPVSNRRFHNNWDLAAARGLRLLDVLIREFGIPESRLSVSSEGANRPKSSNETAEGRAGNRRVEIVIADES